MIKTMDLVKDLESIVDDIMTDMCCRPSVEDIRDNLLGLVDSLYCEHWCDDEEDCCYDDKACIDCEYNDDCENANLPDEDDEEEEE